MSEKFIGRKRELKLLRSLWDKRSASLIVIYGRRRIGKSRLAEEFGKDSRFFYFEGLYPEASTTNQDQLDAFHQKYKHYFPESPKDRFSDWLEAFHELSLRVQNGKTVILLDEISWMGKYDLNFLGKIKNTWDMDFKQNNRLVLILCGSVSSWIERRLLKHEGFFGRISLKLRLEEQPLSDCNHYWKDANSQVSEIDKLKMLSVTGGIPKYLEEINPRLSAEENIRALCFSKTGLLMNDYNYIFSSMMERDSTVYQEVVEVLCQHNMLRNEMLETMSKKSGGLLSNYIDELESSGFVSRDFTWNLKTGDFSKISQYRLRDNYIRFYAKYIMPNIPKINNGQFAFASLSSLPGWAAIMGLQIENLVLSNRAEILSLMGVCQGEVLCDGPFFQRKTTKTRGCQIDYMVQTTLGVLYVCEIKFTRDLVSMSVVQAMREKIQKMSVPKRMSIVPVLLHVGGVREDVIDAQYFAKIIDLADLLR